MIESLPQPLRGIVLFVRDFMLALGEHSVYSHAAALSFYLIFSIPPALLGIVALAGMLPVEAWVQSGLQDADVVITWLYGLFLDPIGAAAATDSLLISWAPLTDTLRDLDKDGMVMHLHHFLQDHTPPAISQTVFKFLRDVLGNSQPALLTVGFVGVLWSASGVTREVLRSINTIHELKPRPWWRQNLVSLGMTLTLLATGTIFFVLLPLSSALIEALSSGGALIVTWRIIGGFAALYLLYSLMQMVYRWAVFAKLPARRTREGVIVTILLWAALAWILRSWGQVGLDRYSATYGALASIVFLLVWIYAMAISLFLGVEWNATRLSQGPWWEILLGDRARPYTRRAAERERLPRGPWGHREVHSPPAEESVGEEADPEVDRDVDAEDSEDR